MLSKGGPRYGLRQGNFTCEPTLVQSALVQPMTTTKAPTNISNGWKIYPNPATHQLFLERSTERDFGVGTSESAKWPVVIFHASGKRMYEREWTATTSTLRVNIQYWPAGMYFVQTKRQGVPTTQKFSILK
ncbi:MAG: T9SS type A sorting domain-containing protein [Bacteroidota bacterium]